MPTLHIKSITSDHKKNGDLPGSNSSWPSKTSAVYLVSKTLLDYALTVPTLLLLSPMLVLVAFLIRLDSPGPIFNRRRVVGLNGREFYALKFRTTGGNGDDCPTHIGRLLRLYNLDDLPQLFNILCRDMSLIGPRIITQPETAMYGRYRQARLTVYPGLTGLWQISAHCASHEEQVRLDLTYVQQWTPWLDLKILLWTIPAALKG